MARRLVKVETCDRCGAEVHPDPALSVTRICVNDDSYRIWLCEDCKRACLGDIAAYTLYGAAEPAGHRPPPRQVDRRPVPIPRRTADETTAGSAEGVPAELPPATFLRDTGYNRRRA